MILIKNGDKRVFSDSNVEDIKMFLANGWTEVKEEKVEKPKKNSKSE